MNKYLSILVGGVLLLNLGTLAVNNLVIRPATIDYHELSSACYHEGFAAGRLKAVSERVVELGGTLSARTNKLLEDGATSGCRVRPVEKAGTNG